VSSQGLRSRVSAPKAFATESVTVVSVRDISGQRRELMGVDSAGRVLELGTKGTGRRMIAGFISFAQSREERLELTEVVLDSPLVLGIVGTTGYGSVLSASDPWEHAAAEQREYTATAIYRVAIGEPTTDSESLADYAATLEDSPYVRAEPLLAPDLTGDLVDDACALSGVTRAELGQLAGGVSERAVYGWRERVPATRRPLLESLRAIGLLLYAGLGASGVRHWLEVGDPSPWELIERGQLEEAVTLARRAATSPAT
jgi:hypothetical protein